MNDGLTLREIAQLASDRNGGVRGRALDRAAKKAGLTLSYTTVDRILAGTYTSTPSRKTLEALAALANVPVDDVFRAAGVPVPLARFAEQLPPDADLLTGQQREAVLAVVRQFAAANRALREREDVMGNAEHPAATSLADRRGRLSQQEYDETVRAAAEAARTRTTPPRPDPQKSAGEESQDEGHVEPA